MQDAARCTSLVWSVGKGMTPSLIHGSALDSLMCMFMVLHLCKSLFYVHHDLLDLTCLRVGTDANPSTYPCLPKAEHALPWVAVTTYSHRMQQ